jgi:Protein of unknown function (DUF2934)
MSKQSKQISPESRGDVATEIPAADAVGVTVVNPEEVCQLAYSYWQARGCPDSSPEEDWFRAERELNGRKAVSAAQ